MWSYYGSKTNISKVYPKPNFNKIIEPFAGAGKYSLEHFENDVLLVDKWSIIIDIWKWLQLCSEKDILGLPRLKEGEKIRDYNLDCEEAYLFMGFTIADGSQAPRNKASYRSTTSRPNKIDTRLKRTASSLFKIRHWRFECGSYEMMPNERATWFIDPPYQFGGDVYKESNKNLDYQKLAEWSMEREGQIIVCENTKADWMPFQPLIEIKGSTRKTTEAIWTNDPDFNLTKQLDLFKF